MPDKCGQQAFCINIWRCCCEQCYEPESENPQYRKTEENRGTASQIADVPAILRNIESSRELKTMWEKYRRQFAYATHIEYSQIMDVLKMLVT